MAMRELARALVAECGEDSVSAAPEALSAASVDESCCAPALPELVFWPRESAHVQRALGLCGALGIPVTPLGALTGKSGGAIPVRGGLALAMTRMNRILEISVEDMVAVCQPGVITGDLMKAAETRALFYPPDPASLKECTVGGNVAENAGGPRALKYGVTRDYVLGLEVALMSGALLRTGKRSIKGVAGYDLTSLFVGSEGTLGVVTEITLQLQPLPRAVVTALLCFTSLDGAARAVTAILTGGCLPRTLELLDDTAIAAVDGAGFDFPPGARAALIVELDGESSPRLMKELDALALKCAPFDLRDVRAAASDAEREHLWEARQRVSRALLALRPFKVSEDVAVPRSKIVEAIARVKAIGAAHGLLTATYGHAGDGNLHVNFLYDDEALRPAVTRATAALMEMTLALGGTITGEHGVGLAKRDFLPLELGATSLGLHRQLKSLLDPKGLLNPGKVI